jgi:hypothetical protein
MCPISASTVKKIDDRFLMVYKRMPFTGKIVLSSRGKIYIILSFPPRLEPIKSQ